MKQQRTSRKDDNHSARSHGNSKPSRVPRTSRISSSRGSDDRPKRPYTKSSGSERPYSPRPHQDGASSDRPRRDGDSRPFRKPYGDRPSAPRRDGDKPYFPKPRRDDDRPFTIKKRGDNASNDRPKHDGDSRPFKKPYGNKPTIHRRDDDRPSTPRRDGDKSYPPRPRRDNDTSSGHSLKKRLYTNPERPERQQSESNFDEFLNDKRKTNKKTILTLSSAKQDVAYERIKKRATPVLQFSDKGLIRLNKFIAQAGICSRREADNLIANGMIKVNGEIVTEMGIKIAPTDLIEYKGQRLQGEKMVYILMNKPKDYITTSDDPEGRKTVLDLIGTACQERVYPVGRLDRNTTGVLLLTNDGQVAQKLMHPSNNIKKLYQIDLDRPLTQEDYITIKAGVTLEDGFIQPDALEYGNELHQIGIEIHSGRNRIVRRIFESLGYTVARLDRIAIGSLTKKTLPRGHWRFLSEKEIGFLKMMKI